MTRTHTQGLYFQRQAMFIQELRSINPRSVLLRPHIMPTLSLRGAWNNCKTLNSSLFGGARLRPAQWAGQRCIWACIYLFSCITRVNFMQTHFKDKRLIIPLEVFHENEPNININIDIWRNYWGVTDSGDNMGTWLEKDPQKGLFYWEKIGWGSPFRIRLLGFVIVMERKKFKQK